MKKPAGHAAGHKDAGFWSALPRPVFVLAPMANVTDAVFRSLFAKHGRPDVTWTEFVSADGLVHADKTGRAKLAVDLEFSPEERPIVAQLFTGHPEAMRSAAALCEKLGFDGVDINMGCPDRAVERQGGGASLIRNDKAAITVIEAARAGAPGIPVSVKTRLGYNKPAVEGWLGMLLSLRPVLPALTVHLRTRKEMSEVPAHWELMPEIVALRDRLQADLSREGRTRIIGNGDLGSLDDAARRVRESGCDGAMIGRGIFGTPWFFEKLGNAAAKSRSGNLAPTLEPAPRSPAERLTAMLEHARLFEKRYCGRKRLKSFAVMKKHFKAYVSGWDGAKELRAALMETETYAQVKAVVDEYLASSVLH